MSIVCNNRSKDLSIRSFKIFYQNEEYVLEITENMFIYAWYNCRFQYRKKYINWSFKEQYFPICIFNDLNQVTNNSIKNSFFSY